ncbi:uncharacterized protein TNCV_952581 [Trichonephila clavipes]|nr:uncharacterized protein TNCV_952581 [Trichonephila clavipes]
MQDGAPPHIANPVKQLLKGHFGNNRVINHLFLTALTARLSDLNLIDFWLQCHLKDVVFRSPITHLAELKSRIAQHILSVTP